MAQTAKDSLAMQETWVRSLGWEDPLEKGMATHSRILAWRSPGMVESLGSQRVGHNQVTFTHSQINKQNQILMISECHSVMVFYSSAESVLT